MQCEAGNVPIRIIEPVSNKKAALFAESLVSGRQERFSSREVENLQEIKCRLKNIREHTRDNITALGEQLSSVLSRLYPGVNPVLCANSDDAVSYIQAVASGIRTISVNNSSVVARELKPALIRGNCTVINSYLSEFAVQEKMIRDYWDIPLLLENKNNPAGSFDVSLRMNGLDGQGPSGAAAKKYLAVLGVNAAGAEDGSLFFLQHFHNIAHDLADAQKVVLVIGLDKIVKTGKDAGFVAECMGVFGMESTLLGIQPAKEQVPSVADMELPPADGERELHVILLDNGRTDLSQTRFRDLLLCIGCRACNRFCPIRYSFADNNHLWTPRNYLQDFLDGCTGSLDTCLHCEACRYVCPVDIDLPALMWEAQRQPAKKHKRSFYHRILGSPELLAGAGSFIAPLANRLMHMYPVRIIMEYVTGIDRNSNLPLFHESTFRKDFKKEFLRHEK